MIKKIVITGGPGAGKTTVVNLLKNHPEILGLPDFTLKFVDEAASYLLDNNLTDRNDPYKFQTDIFNRSIYAENQVLADCSADKNYIVICDRGAMDGKSFIDQKTFTEIISKSGFNENQVMNRYDGVFHLISPSRECPEFYTQHTNHNRIESIQEAAELDKRTEKVWTPHPNFYVITNQNGDPGKYFELADKIKYLIVGRR